MFEVRDVSSLPIPTVDEAQMEQHVREIVEIKQKWSARTEPSAMFVTFYDKLARSRTLLDFVSTAKAEASSDLDRLRNLQAKTDSIVESSAGLSQADCQLLQTVLGDSPGASISLEFGPELTGCDGKFWSGQMISYALGAAFGRWDIRYTTGEKQLSELPSPFAPLPACPPGQLQNEHGFSISKKDGENLRQTSHGGYPVEIPWDGLLVDDPSHSLDIEARVRQALQVVWKGRWEAVEHEACGILGLKSLRDYFRKPSGFFADHLKRYSKSRRQAPIYWPLSTASGSYTLWLYYHRLTDNTLHTALADFIGPKLRSVRVEISSLRESGTHRDRLEELLDLEKELEDFRAEIERIIKLPWKPNLNDGVLITASPLWKLFRLPKWQKSLKACWEKLEKGDYDWAHLAYSIWPIRVEKVCKTDRSIAIAHGLEHLCTVAAPKPKAKRSKKSARP